MGIVKTKKQAINELYNECIELRRYNRELEHYINAILTILVDNELIDVDEINQLKKDFEFQMVAENNGQTN